MEGQTYQRITAFMHLSVLDDYERMNHAGGDFRP